MTKRGQMLSLCVAAGCSVRSVTTGWKRCRLSAEPQFLWVKRRTLHVCTGADWIGDWMVVFVRPCLVAAAAAVWSQSIFPHMQVQCKHIRKGSFSTLKIRCRTYKETSAGVRDAGNHPSIVVGVFFLPLRSVCSLLTSNRTRLEPDCVTASIRPGVLRRQRLIAVKGAFRTCLCSSVLLGQILLTTRKSWLFLVA